MKERNFRLGTTSFIYPDNIIPNVRQIGQFFDEIELLVFESLPHEVVPSPEDVRTLADLGRQLDVAYNVHLPVDVSLTAETPKERQLACDRLTSVVDRFAPLCPTTFTLHLDMDKRLAGHHKTDHDILLWNQRALEGLEGFVPRLDDASRISIETLWYDPELLLPLVDAFGLSLCADAGHHFKYGYDLARTFELFSDRISIVHLHGVDLTGERAKDHVGLDRMADDHFCQVVEVLAGFTGTLSLEVFNYANLDASLNRLADVFSNISALQ